MDRRRLIEGYHPEGLPSAWPLGGFHHDARALAGGRESVAAQARDVNQDVGRAVIGKDEAEALRHIEPFDAPRNLDEVEGALHLSVAEVGATSTGRFTHRALAVRA